METYVEPRRAIGWFVYGLSREWVEIMVGGCNVPVPYEGGIHVLDRLL